MTVAITCAGCRRMLRVPDDHVGRAVQCPLCIETFVAEADPVQPPAAAPARKRVVAALADPPAPDGDLVVLEEVAGSEEPAVAPTRPTKPFRPVPFGVRFVHDPDRLLRGRAECEVSIDGLRVRLRSRRDHWVSVLGPHSARYLGGNRIAVWLDGREVTVELVRARCDLNRLARDVVAYLNGGRAELNLRAYALPWKLTLLPWLAVAVPFLAMWLRVLGGVHGGGRFLWFLICGIALLMGIKSLRGESLSTGRRMAVAAGAAGFCFLLLGAAFAYRLANPMTVPDSAWSQFAAPAHFFRVDMPGPPQIFGRPVAGINSTVYAASYHSAGKRFSVSVGAVADKDQFNLLENYAWQLANEVGFSGYSRLDHIVPRSGERVSGIQVVIQLAEWKYDDLGELSKGTQVSRLFVAHDKLYTLSVSGEDVDSGDSDVRRFFDSFQILPLPRALAPTELAGVVAYWSFDDLNQEDGMEFPEFPRLVEGKRNQAIAGGWVNLDKVPNLDFKAGEPFSVVGWFRTQQRFDLSPCILSMRNGPAVPNQGGIEIFLENGWLLAQVDTTRLNDGSLLRGPQVTDGAWHHVALTRSKDGSLVLYFDGTQASALPGRPNTAGALITTLRSLGCRRTDNWNNLVALLNGALDEVAFYNRCLSAAEVKRLVPAPAP